MGTRTQSLTVGQRIREERERQQQTRGELAKRAGLSLDGLAKIELGTRKDPGVGAVAKLAAALGVTIDSLVYGR